MIGNAIKIAKIATGAIEDDAADDGKDAAAVAMGKKGGAARAKAMTPERRAEIAKAAAAKRWKKPQFYEVFDPGGPKQREGSYRGGRLALEAAGSPSIALCGNRAFSM